MSKGTDQSGTSPSDATGKQLRGSSLLLVGRMLSKFVNFGVQVAVVRLLSKGDYGVFAYGLALALAGELVVKFGLGRGANRFVPYYAERGDRAEVMGTLALVTGTIITLGLVGFALLWWVASLGVSGIPQGEGTRIVLILAALAPVQALDTIGIQTLACFARPREILFRKHVLGPGLRAAAVIGVFVAGGGVEALAYAYLAGATFGLALCLQLAHRQLRAHDILPLPLVAWRVPWRALFRFSFPLMSSDLVFIVLTGITSVGLMMTGGESAVASMRAVVPAAGLIGLVVQSFSMLYIPSAMRLHARGEDASLKEHHWRSAAWVAVLSFPLFGLTFAIAPAFVPTLLGESYADSARLLAILALGHYASVCMAFNGDTLQVFERTQAIVRTDFMTIALGAGLALWLCPTYGAMGAAISVTTARIAGATARQFVLLRTPGMARVPSAQKVIWASLALATVLASAIGWLWHPPFLVQLASLAALSLALLRATAPRLEIADSFPELRRIPLFARVVGV